MKYMMSKSLYHDRSAWRTFFVNLQELIFLPGYWLERDREREREREREIARELHYIKIRNVLRFTEFAHRHFS